MKWTCSLDDDIDKKNPHSINAPLTQGLVTLKAESEKNDLDPGTWTWEGIISEGHHSSEKKNV